MYINLCFTNLRQVTFADGNHVNDVTRSQLKAAPIYGIVAAKRDLAHIVIKMHHI